MLQDSGQPNQEATEVKEIRIYFTPDANFHYATSVVSYGDTLDCSDISPILEKHLKKYTKAWQRLSHK